MAATQQIMANSSILGASPAPSRHAGTDVDALGPSDSSDSGSDVQGETPMATSPDNAAEWGGLPSKKNSDSDSMGTGERAAAAGSEVVSGADILPDHTLAGDGSNDDEDLDAAAGGDDPRDLAVLGEPDQSVVEDEDADPVGGSGAGQR